MFCEKIDLYAYFGVSRGGADGGMLRVYAPEKTGDLSPKRRPAALVIPGGGYGMVSEREGEPVAIRFLGGGYACFVLTYTVNTAYPVPLIEAGMAMAYIKENAPKYGVDGDKVCAVGFSAGGHLTGMLATLFNDENLKIVLKDRAKLVRPDAVVLSYPVVTTGVKTHGDTARVISGGDEEFKRKLSVEKRVTKNSSPAFIWHTMEDDCVPVRNALLLADAYEKHGVPFELHIFEKGGHGTSVAGIETSPEEIVPLISHLSAWIDLAFTWLKKRGFAVHD